MVKDNSMSSKILDIIVYTVAIFSLAVTLLPLLHLFALSFSSPDAITNGRVGLIPCNITLFSYKRIFMAGTIPRAFINSVLYTSVGVIISMLLTTTLAYGMSKKRLPFRGVFTGMTLFTMFFSGGIIPTFILIKTLGFYNNIWALVMPSAISTYNMIIMRTFFANLPDELEESAFLDGANDIIVFAKIILPISKAGIATVTLFYMVALWNQFMPGVMYMKTASKYPLQVVLRSIVMAGESSKEVVNYANDDMLSSAGALEAVKYASLFFSIIPMMLVYPFIQKYFVKGVMIGSLKG
jgi:ABC-type sugar transport system, permease component